MRRLYIFALAIAVLYLLALARLGRLDAGGPAHSLVNLPGNEPATLYLPGEGNPFFEVFPRPNRPPAIVMVHGFSADRVFMSTLARRIAQNGYAVLAIDVSGHGENRNPFPGGMVEDHSLRPDLKRAVDFLRGYDKVDGSRIVVMGHSMGAGATLDYSTSDPQLKGAIMISGGFGLSAGERPRNTLFIYAERDPEFIRESSAEIAGHLAGTQVEPGKTYGDFKDGTAVEAVLVPGVNHVTIVSSPQATETMIKWLDRATGTSRTGAINLLEPRRAAAAVAALLFAVLLVPLGIIGGELAGKWDYSPGGIGGWWGLLILAVGMIATMPLVRRMVPAEFLPLVIGNSQASWSFAAGLILLLVLLVLKTFEWERLRAGIASTILMAAVVVAIIYMCMVAMSVTFHNEALTPERLVCAIIAAFLLFPFWLSFEFLLRRGSVAIATVRVVIGRIVILALTVAAVFLNVLPFVLILIIPSIALLYVTVEIFAASAYFSSRNLVLIALVESAWFALSLAANNPITFSF